MTAPEVIHHAKRILTAALGDMDTLLGMFEQKEVLTMDMLMTRKEAAAFIGRTVKTIDRLALEGKITKIYGYGQPRIRKSELLKFKGIVFENPADLEKPVSELDRIIQRFSHRNTKRK